MELEVEGGRSQMVFKKWAAVKLVFERVCGGLLRCWVPCSIGESNGVFSRLSVRGQIKGD